MTDTAGKKLQKDPEVVEKAARRRFTAEYKRQIALEAEQCKQPGEIGALLRREGLYSSVLLLASSTSGGIIGIIKKVRHQRQSIASPRTRRLKRENERLKEKLRQAELIIDVQKKKNSEMIQTRSQEKED